MTTLGRVLNGKPEHISKYQTELNKFDLAFYYQLFRTTDVALIR